MRELCKAFFSYNTFASNLWATATFISTLETQHPARNRILEVCE